MNPQATHGGHAVVIGASMAGLAAARALSGHFDRVTVLDADDPADGPSPRKGVPQGLHAHGLLARGRDGLERLFPGLADELIGAGALAADMQADCAWIDHGARLCRASSGLDGMVVSRPMLEDRVRRRVRALPNLRLLGRCRVTGLETDPSRACVTGVRAALRGEPTTVLADLVVDASGRGSRTPAWLAGLGYRPPDEETLDIGICYTTRVYRRRTGKAGEPLAVIARDEGPAFRFGVALAQEDGRWIVTIGGYTGDAAPCDDAGALAFARTVPAPEIVEIMGTAEPLSDFRGYRFPSSLRRRYEHLRRFPEGLLVIGDALCSFNPTYGQGMTVAALEAGLLADCLEGGTDRLARRFSPKAAALIDIPWQMVTVNDLAHPGIAGRRTLRTRAFHWYAARLYRAGRTDPVLAHRFLRVANLVDTPIGLLRPTTVLRVIAGHLVRRPGSGFAADGERRRAA